MSADASDDLDDAIALVYAQPPSGFVAARSALVKELKAAKRKDDAATVAALRRPTKLAWALGAAVRRAPEPAAAFFAAIDALGEPGRNLRQRTADLRSAVAALVGSVEGVDPGEATAAMLATAADPDATAALRRGRLAELPAAGGFGGLGLGLEATLAPSADATGTEEEGAPAAGAASQAEDDGEDGEAGEAADEAAARQRRQEEEDAARAQAERVAALEAERETAAAAEVAAAGRVEAAQAAVAEAQAELGRATSASEAARAAAEEAAARLQDATS